MKSVPNIKAYFMYFSNIRNYLSIDNIKTIYYTIIYSRIKYGLIIYGQAGSTKLKKSTNTTKPVIKSATWQKIYRFPTNSLGNPIHFGRHDPETLGIRRDP